MSAVDELDGHGMAKGELGYCLQSLRHSQLTPNSPWDGPGGGVRPDVEGLRLEASRCPGANFVGFVG